MHPCTLYIYLSENIYEAILRPPYKYNMIIFSRYSENLDSVKRYKTKHKPTQHV